MPAAAPRPPDRGRNGVSRCRGWDGLLGEGHVRLAVRRLTRNRMSRAFLGVCRSLFCEFAPVFPGRFRAMGCAGARAMVWRHLGHWYY